MIRLTRLRNANPLYINPDHIERLDSYHETTVHLSNGNEYVVTEPADAIVRLINEQRAGLLALALRLERDLPLPAMSSQAFAERDSLEDVVDIPIAVDAADEIAAPADVPVNDAADVTADDAVWKPAPQPDDSSSTDAENDGR
jgi:uncharacterized protein YlzI (FlbEa/FlbD family)